SGVVTALRLSSSPRSKRSDISRKFDVFATRTRINPITTITDAPISHGNSCRRSAGTVFSHGPTWTIVRCSQLRVTATCAASWASSGHRRASHSWPAALATCRDRDRGASNWSRCWNSRRLAHTSYALCPCPLAPGPEISPHPHGPVWLSAPAAIRSPPEADTHLPAPRTREDPAGKPAVRHPTVPPPRGQ